jgi:hypothetical protein
MTSHNFKYITRKFAFFVLPLAAFVNAAFGLNVSALPHRVTSESDASIFLAACPNHTTGEVCAPGWGGTEPMFGTYRVVSIIQTNREDADPWGSAYMLTLTFHVDKVAPQDFRHASVYASPVEVVDMCNYPQQTSTVSAEVTSVEHNSSHSGIGLIAHIKITKHFRGYNPREETFSTLMVYTFNNGGLYTGCKEYEHPGLYNAYCSLGPSTQSLCIHYN